MHDPPRFDSRQWTGDYSRTPDKSSPDTSTEGVAPLVGSLFGTGLLFFCGRPLMWSLSGSPLLLSTSRDAGPPLILGICVAVVAAYVVKAKTIYGRFAVALFALGCTVFLVLEYQYFSDLFSPKAERATISFVEGVTPQGLGKNRRLVPEIKMQTNDGTQLIMIAPSSFADRLVPGASCLTFRILTGSHGFQFADQVDVKGQTTSRAISSYDIDKYRQRCLRGSAQ